MHPLLPHEQQKLDEFSSVYAACADAYKYAKFSFIAVDGPNGLELAQGHVSHPVGKPSLPDLTVKTSTICGCSVPLSKLGIDYMGVISALQGDGIETPVGCVRFGDYESINNNFSVYLEKLPSNFYTPIIHPLRMCISTGSHVFQNRMAEFQSDLRSGIVPYDSIVELAGELNLYPLRWDVCSLDVTAEGIVAIDLSGRARIQNGVANLMIRVAKGVDRTQARLGYRVQTPDRRATERGAFDSSQLTWSDDGDYVVVGSVDIDVPKGSVVQAFASYGSRWIHQGWITDPDNSANVRRSMHEVFDPNLDGTKKSLFDAKSHRQDARILEAGVGNLMFMYGFAVNPLSSHFTTDAADLLAVSPNGNIVVIECTTGAINSNGKLSKLLARSAALLEKLEQTGNPHLKVLPVVVTTMKREALTEEEIASGKGIYIATCEDLERLANESLIPRNADQAFESLWSLVHSPQEQLMLPH
ncbi:hypothetical protein LMA00_23350 [Burkholderia ambifaria]|uniref:hypothetical protein n=1 Tax=Burkholderia ambifaria TaxID=152480 RepID=UPI001E30B789|nr:hypothetical protein [Burkholderia ambifaria]UEP49947.1 hypothetical protein LMA00_23350 [Burkholderia ambifaria]